jgi:hypothetical protein
MDALGIECVYRHANDGRQPPGNVAVQEFLRDHLLGKTSK